jgi:hypothetical protein
MSDANSTKREPDYAAYSLHTTSEGTRWTHIGVGFRRPLRRVTIPTASIGPSWCAELPFLLAQARRPRPPKRFCVMMFGTPVKSTEGFKGCRRAVKSRVPCLLV